MDTPELLRLAEDVAQRAYSPYSRVRVGAALVGLDGRTFRGCNVENASYGLTVCAERNALAHAVAEGVREFRRIVLWSNVARPLPPCGACRQVLSEFAPTLQVVWGGAGGAPREAALDELLGHALTGADVRAVVTDEDGQPARPGNRPTSER
ncbi:MAG: cytidine deaminase [Planctomycetota bacterium]